LSTSNALYYSAGSLSDAGIYHSAKGASLFGKRSLIIRREGALRGADAKAKAVKGRNLHGCLGRGFGLRSLFCASKSLTAMASVIKRYAALTGFIFSLSLIDLSAYFRSLTPRVSAYFRILAPKSANARHRAMPS